MSNESVTCDLGPVPSVLANPDISGLGVSILGYYQDQSETFEAHSMY